MSHKLCLALLLGFGLFVLGCGGGEEPAAGPVAVAPPAPPAPAPPAPTEEVVAPTPDTTPETTPPVIDAPNTVDPEIGGTDINAAANFVAAAGPLAAHAKGLSVVRPEHYAVIKFDLEGARQAKLLKDLPVDPAAMAGELAVGDDATAVADQLTNVDLIWLVIGPPSDELVGKGAPPFTFGAYAVFKTPEALAEATKGFGIGEMIEATYNGVTYLKPAVAGQGPTYFTQDRELFMATYEATIHQVIDAQGKLADLPLLTKMKDAPLDANVMLAGSLGSMREPVTQALTEMISNSGLPLAPTTAKLPAQIEYGTIAINLDGDTLIDIDADMDNPQNAAVMKETLNGLVSLGKIMLGQQAAQLPDEPASKQSFALVMSLVNAIKVSHNDVHVDVSLAHVPELDKLPEIIAATQGAAATADSMNNGRMLALAALNHESAMRKFPANLKNEAGEDALSWRVALLDYVDADLGGNEIDKKSAWDSAANAKVSELAIEMFQTAGSDAPNTTTWKMVPEAAGDLLFIEGGKGSSVPWTKPDTFVFDPADPTASLGEEPENGYVVAFRDGHVERLTTDQIKTHLSSDADDTPPTDTPADEPGIEPERAAAGPAERIWRTAAGGREVKATFVKRIGDKITIRRSDNDMEVTIPVDILSVEDQDYLKSLKK